MVNQRSNLFSTFVRRHLVICLLAVGLALSLPVSGGAMSMDFSGDTVHGGDPNYTPDITVDFDVKRRRRQLTLTITSNDLSSYYGDIEHAVRGVTFDLDGYTGTLTAVGVTATYADGGVISSLLHSDGDVSKFWAFRDDLAAQGYGQYGASSSRILGDGAETFSSGDMIGDARYGDFMRSGFRDDRDTNSYREIEIAFSYTGRLTSNMVQNVTPVFGSRGMPTGMPVVPEPNSALLFGIALLTLGRSVRRRKR